MLLLMLLLLVSLLLLTKGVSTVVAGGMVDVSTHDSGLLLRCNGVLTDTDGGESPPPAMPAVVNSAPTVGVSR